MTAHNRKTVQNGNGIVYIVRNAIIEVHRQHMLCIVRTKSVGRANQIDMVDRVVHTNIARKDRATCEIIGFTQSCTLLQRSLISFETAVKLHASLQCPALFRCQINLPVIDTIFTDFLETLHPDFITGLGLFQRRFKLDNVCPSVVHTRRYQSRRHKQGKDISLPPLLFP